MIIFNQREYVRQILIDHKKPDNMSVKGLIVYLCKYFYEDCKDLSQAQYASQIRNILRSFNFDIGEYEEYKYVSVIDNIVRKIMTDKMPHTLTNNTEIKITKSEWKVITSCEDERHMKLLFTLYALAKTYSPATGWVNYAETDIFKLANVAGNIDEKMAMLRDLYKEGKIQINHKIDRSGYQVQLGEDVNDVEMTMTRFEYFGNQFLAHYRKGYIVCEDCGRLIKKKGKNHRWCKQCAHKRYLEAKNEWQKEANLNNIGNF